jgi:hypothetical protein
VAWAFDAAARRLRGDKANGGKGTSYGYWHLNFSIEADERDRLRSIAQQSKTATMTPAAAALRADSVFRNFHGKFIASSINFHCKFYSKPTPVRDCVRVLG